MKPEEIQALVDKAIAAKTDELRSEVRAELDHQNEHERMTMMSKAANEGNRLYMDPGTGYEYAIIPLDKVDYNPLSRRSKDELDPKSPGMKKLQEDIKAKGGLNRPLLVYRKGDRYMLVKGSRRLAALRAMGEELNHAYILPAKPPMDMEENWVNGY